ncbi:hypothetical protein GZL_07844 [Streptomyces sp. 769]|nr:hypothetical protein GZL_07844 [Streptomyces sp. 769]
MISQGVSKRFRFTVRQHQVDVTLMLVNPVQHQGDTDLAGVTGAGSRCSSAERGMPTTDSRHRDLLR